MLAGTNEHHLSDSPARTFSDSSDSRSPTMTELSQTEVDVDIFKKTQVLDPNSSQALGSRLQELYSDNITAKVLRAAVNCLQNNSPITEFPEWVPQSGPNAGKYECREADFWTCGFFPGLIYTVLERLIKYPQSAPIGTSNSIIIKKLHELGEIWSNPIHPMGARTDTHDMSFIIQPSMRPRWELFHDEKALSTIITAAESLYTRYSPEIGAIRSWDQLTQKGVNITSMEHDFLVIIDSMCNLDLLYYAAAHTGRKRLADAATRHAHKLLRTHLRHETGTYSHRKGYNGPLFSTFHVTNFDPATGCLKEARTGQGYAKDSTWARGQAWGILGYSQTFQWTGEEEFLTAACGLAEYFLLRLEMAPDCVEQTISAGSNGNDTSERRTCGRLVPLWDFDAPVDEANPLRDSSAGVIAANGLLVLAQSLISRGEHSKGRRYLEAALSLVEDALALSLADEKASILVLGDEILVEDLQPYARFEAILKNATANHNASDHRRYWDHGLVYGDYYLVEFGNRLLRMGLA
ncbi:uncharacterized protein N7484_007880 [Penicillium longicatenatum]|uniref:uncharacterized protein n=1 Tax=Penicillium longicatenatum TaxID=1561947 RepID=UPI0025476162|nr:uncharacterized protein N7484_007880 [Penicillium longicatenatum]KAJ5640018.1 hypothetical protein N7484_007880 [Penicillium longicatenatum]